MHCAWARVLGFAELCDDGWPAADVLALATPGLFEPDEQAVTDRPSATSPMAIAPARRGERRSPRFRLSYTSRSCMSAPLARRIVPGSVCTPRRLTADLQRLLGQS